MADWEHVETILEDKKGRRMKYTYKFSPSQSVFNGNDYDKVFEDGWAWCGKHFGYVEQRFRSGGYEIVFADERDAMQFKLRWC